jgi:hypothetical protein
LNQKRILNTNSYDNSLSTSSKKEKKNSKKANNNSNDDGGGGSGSGLKAKVKPSAIPSQVIEIINTKLSNLIDKPTTNVEKIKSRLSMGLNFENGEYAYEEAEEENENRENNANGGGGGEDSHSESSSSSSSSYQNDESIKEAIRRAAEATGTFTNNRISSSNLKRITIDLSNDPDIRKYFESNIDEEVEQDLDKTLGVIDASKKEKNTTTSSPPLIDIFDQDTSNVSDLN